MRKKSSIFVTETLYEVMLHPERWRLVSKCQPEAGIPSQKKSISMQSHQEREIFFTIYGEYMYGFDNGVVNCTPGTLILIDSNIKHEFLYSDVRCTMLHIWTYKFGDSNISLRCLQISPGKGNDNNCKIKLCSSRSQELALPMDINYWWDIYNAATTASEREMAATRIKLLFACVSLPLIDNIGNCVWNRPSQMEIAIACIEQNLRCKPTIEQLARQVGYSRFHFVRFFKRHTGLTVQEYIDKCKLNEYQKLAAQQLPGKKIAELLGFNSVNCFYRWRKQIKH